MLPTGEGGLRRLCATGESFSVETARERKFPRTSGNKSSGTRMKKKLSRKFPAPFHGFLRARRPSRDKIESSLKRCHAHVSSIDIDTFMSSGLPSFPPLFSPSYQFKLHFITNLCNCDGRVTGIICSTEKLCIRGETPDCRIQKENIAVATM